MRIFQWMTKDASVTLDQVEVPSEPVPTLPQVDALARDSRTEAAIAAALNSGKESVVSVGGSVRSQ